MQKKMSSELYTTEAAASRKKATRESKVAKDPAPEEGEKILAEAEDLSDETVA